MACAYEGTEAGIACPRIQVQLTKPKAKASKRAPEAQAGAAQAIQREAKRARQQTPVEGVALNADLQDEEVFGRHQENWADDIVVTPTMSIGMAAGTVVEFRKVVKTKMPAVHDALASKETIAIKTPLPFLDTCFRAIETALEVRVQVIDDLIFMMSTSKYKSRVEKWIERALEAVPYSNTTDRDVTLDLPDPLSKLAADVVQWSPDTGRGSSGSNDGFAHMKYWVENYRDNNTDRNRALKKFQMLMKRPETRDIVFIAVCLPNKLKADKLRRLGFFDAG
eukprot:m.188183 g.188183  ORF g.188183 m.188183 type:complete len:280 (+) comp15080_c0_seq1:195-1034(+)